MEHIVLESENLPVPSRWAVSLEVAEGVIKELRDQVAILNSEIEKIKEENGTTKPEWDRMIQLEGEIDQLKERRREDAVGAHALDRCAQFRDLTKKVNELEKKFSLSPEIAESAIKTMTEKLWVSHCENEKLKEANITLSAKWAERGEENKKLKEENEEVLAERMPNGGVFKLQDENKKLKEKIKKVRTAHEDLEKENWKLNVAICKGNFADLKKLGALEKVISDSEGWGDWMETLSDKHKQILAEGGYPDEDLGGESE